jgi:hypothetical protein
MSEPLELWRVLATMCVGSLVTCAGMLVGAWLWNRRR